jgi:putative inorganic carbon (HCO3(-)) transporter
MTSSPTIENVSRPASILALLVAGYVMLLPFQFEMGSEKMNFAPADCSLALVLVLAAGQLRYRSEVWTGWHFGIVLLFAAGSFVASMRLGTLNRYELVNKDAGLLLPFLSYAAFTSLITEWQDVRQILRVFVGSAVLQNIVAVGAYFAMYFFGIANPFVRYEGLRLSGMLLDPNAYGGFLVVTLVVAEAASFGPAPLFGKTTLWIIRLTLGLGILFTFSRSAWVALGLSLLVFFALRPREAGRLVLAGLIGAPCLLLVLGPRFVPIFETMASRPKQVQGRFELIHDALAQFARHPVFGGGIGSFRLSEGEIAHNSAMWFLADFGLVGLAVFLGFLGWFFAKSWYAYRFAPTRERPVALALLLAHTAMLGLAMGIEAFYQRHWWLVFGLIASAYSLTLRRVTLRPSTAEEKPDAHAC